jgi:two-component system sensor histidine kinase PilS (NtrC family)
LSAVTQAAELLAEDPLAHAPETARLLRIIGDNAARLENLVKDILALNRRDRLSQQSIALAGWLPEFLDECCHVRGITVRPQLDCPADAVVLFDLNHLHQVLWNLVNNGWRYCQQREGSQILRVRQVDHHWQLSVWNDGPPIAPETLRHLFEPFFTTEVRGTGLGLYIAREICEANHAQIAYEAPPDGGACFRITFGVNHG